MIRIIDKTNGKRELITNDDRGATQQLASWAGDGNWLHVNCGVFFVVCSMQRNLQTFLVSSCRAWGLNFLGPMLINGPAWIRDVEVRILSKKSGLYTNKWVYTANDYTGALILKTSHRGKKEIREYNHYDK
jgi:hypothetical protein